MEESAKEASMAEVAPSPTSLEGPPRSRGAVQEEEKAGEDEVQPRDAGAMSPLPVRMRWRRKMPLQGAPCH